MAGSSVPQTLSPDLKVLKNLWRYLWPSGEFSIRWRFLISAIAMVLAKIATICVPLCFKAAVDGLTSGASGFVLGLSVPLFMILGYGIARLLSAVLSEVRDAVFATVTQRAVREVGVAVFRHLHELGMRFHLDRQTGGLSRSIERGTKGIETLLQFLTFNIIPTILEIVMVCALMSVLYDVRYALVTLLALGGYIGATLVITEWRIHFVRTMNETDNDANTKAVDSLLNFETVKYFNNEDHETQRFAGSLERYQKAAIHSKLSLAFLNITQAVIITAGLIAVMIMATAGIQEKTMTVGDFVALNTYLIQLYVPLFMLGFAYREVKISLVNMDQMFALLNVAQDVVDIQNAPDLAVTKGEITFEDVCFAYAPERPILQGVSFTVKAGETVAIVGASGAGKSTISRLLFRLYDVTNGRILIDEQDIRACAQQSVRRHIGIVPQDTVLFNDSIFYNIAYGAPGASLEEVEQATRQAEILDFIQALPDGFQTQVGERGLKLSGGEKQRVAMARMLLKKPAIYVFDEATSALDTHTEKALQDNLKALSKNHTTVMIAHRLSTVIDAHQIIVLDGGQIAEQGTHRVLLEQGGLYARLWQKQQEKT